MTDHRAERGEPRLQIQYENLPKQAHAAHYGMWLFIASELLLFAGLFGLYTAYRTQYSAEFARGVDHNPLAIGTINTVILILSSFTAAWSVHTLRGGRRRATLVGLGLTMFFGLLFLVLKGIEYGMHFHEGIYPGFHYASREMPGHGFQLFYTLYYFMTGLHAIHMIGGLTMMGWVTARVARYRTTAAYPVPLELGALYWHLVDSIWIFLWPLFYLMG